MEKKDSVCWCIWSEDFLSFSFSSSSHVQSSPLYCSIVIFLVSSHCYILYSFSLSAALDLTRSLLFAPSLCFFSLFSKQLLRLTHNHKDTHIKTYKQQSFSRLMVRYDLTMLLLHSFQGLYNLLKLFSDFLFTQLFLVL